MKKRDKIKISRPGGKVTFSIGEVVRVHISDCESRRAPITGIKHASGEIAVGGFWFPICDVYKVGKGE